VIELLNKSALEAELRRRGKWDESEHPRVPSGSPDGGQFTDGDAAAESSESLTEVFQNGEIGYRSGEHAANELKRLIGGSSYVNEDRNARIAAYRLAKQLQRMKEEGYKMPTTVMVMTVASRSPAGHLAQTRSGEDRILTLDVPASNEFSDKMTLDIMTRAAFSGTGPSGNPRFAVSQSFDDVIVHEMGHVQAGARGSDPGEANWLNHAIVPGGGASWPSIKAAAIKISEYATKNTDEFLAETFTHLYRGGALADDTKKLYEALQGPIVRRRP
jgi:hypothetical protein